MTILEWITEKIRGTVVGWSINKNVAFSKLRIYELEVYVIEGWLGNDVTKWPVYAFYQVYLNGQHEAAHAAYCNWYLDQLRKYHTTAKEKGGMHEGSLYRLIVQKYAENGIDSQDDIFSDPAIVAQGIKERVDQRFALLESIRQRGYDSKVPEPAVGIKKRGCVYIINGGHRWAALKALGYDSFPEVRVLNGNILNLKKNMRRTLGKWKTIMGRK